MRMFSVFTENIEQSSYWVQKNNLIFLYVLEYQYE